MRSLRSVDDSPLHYQLSHHGYELSHESWLLIPKFEKWFNEHSNPLSDPKGYVNLHVPPDGRMTPLLTLAQARIMAAIAYGDYYKQIADDMGMTEAGVKQHVAQMKKKYGLKRTVELIGLWHREVRTATLFAGYSDSAENKPARATVLIFQRKDLIKDVRSYPFEIQIIHKYIENRFQTMDGKVIQIRRPTVVWREHIDNKN